MQKKGKVVKRDKLQVVIVGGGYGGVSVANQLKK
jgi:NADH dehydrogenase FAD-containing subunit